MSPYILAEHHRRGVAVFSLLPKAVFVFVTAVNLDPLVKLVGRPHVKCYIVAAVEVHKGKVSVQSLESSAIEGRGGRQSGGCHGMSVKAEGFLFLFANCGAKDPTHASCMVGKCSITEPPPSTEGLGETRTKSIRPCFKSRETRHQTGGY